MRLRLVLCSTTSWFRTIAWTAPATTCDSAQHRPCSAAILYYTILYYTILYYTILYYTILYYTILYYTILYYTILYYTILYYTILYYTILYYTILYYTILYYTILYYTILYYTILYYTILYYTILYYTILYYIHYTLYTIHYTLYTTHYTLYYTVLPNFFFGFVLVSWLGYLASVVFDRRACMLPGNERSEGIGVPQVHTMCRDSNINDCARNTSNKKNPTLNPIKLSWLTEQAEKGPRKQHQTKLKTLSTISLSIAHGPPEPSSTLLRPTGTPTSPEA